MKQKFTASIWQEDGWFIAQCVEVDVASQGETEDEALENLRDALELHFHAAGSNSSSTNSLAPELKVSVRVAD